MPCGSHESVNRATVPRESSQMHGVRDGTHGSGGRVRFAVNCKASPGSATAPTGYWLSCLRPADDMSTACAAGSYRSAATHCAGSRRRKSFSLSIPPKPVSLTVSQIFLPRYHSSPEGERGDREFPHSATNTVVHLRGLLAKARREKQRARLTWQHRHRGPQRVVHGYRTWAEKFAGGLHPRGALSPR